MNTTDSIQLTNDCLCFQFTFHHEIKNIGLFKQQCNAGLLSVKWVVTTPRNNKNYLEKKLSYTSFTQVHAES